VSDKFTRGSSEGVQIEVKYEKSGYSIYLQLTPEETREMGDAIFKCVSRGGLVIVEQCFRRWYIIVEFLKSVIIKVRKVS